MAARSRHLLLWAAATDQTFTLARLDGHLTLVGKCIHCGRKLLIDVAGADCAVATLEHIVPRHHGGTDALENLAVACAKCNAAKGYRHDCRSRDDEALVRVVEVLRKRRLDRWREPPETLLAALPPRPLQIARTRRGGSKRRAG